MRKVHATNEKRKPKQRQRRPYLGLFVKLYINSLNDRKIRQMDAVTRCFWMDVLMLAKPNRGVLPCDADIAYTLRMTDGEVRSILLKLASLELLDEDHINGHVAYTVHQWDKWQSDTLSTERVRRHRDREAASPERHRDDGETLLKRERNVSCNDETNSNSTFLSLDRKNSIHEKKNSRLDGRPVLPAAGVTRNGGAA